MKDWIEVVTLTELRKRNKAAGDTDDGLGLDELVENGYEEDMTELYTGAMGYAVVDGVAETVDLSVAFAGVQEIVDLELVEYGVWMRGRLFDEGHLAAVRLRDGSLWTRTKMVEGKTA